MTTYRIAWYVDVEDDSPIAAANQALTMQRDPESLATVFTVSGPEGSVCVDAETGETYPSDVEEKRGE